MSVGINTNYYNGVSQAQQTQKTDKVDYNEKPQTLDDFKRDIYGTINKMPVRLRENVGLR